MPFLQGEPLILYLPNGRTISIPCLREGLKTHVDGHLVPHILLMTEGSEGVPFALERGGWVLPFRPTHGESLSTLKRRTILRRETVRAALPIPDSRTRWPGLMSAHIRISP